MTSGCLISGGLDALAQAIENVNGLKLFAIACERLLDLEKIYFRDLLPAKQGRGRSRRRRRS